VSQNRTDDNLEELLTQADEMDASGDERQPSSPFQQRLKRQIVLLQEAWQALFTEPLYQLTAKQMLQAAHSQALDVYSAMQIAHERGVQYPRGYVTKILEGLAKKPTPIKRKTKPGGLRPVTQ
jgi:hypothetical protein